MPSTATSPDELRHERVMVFIDGSNLYHVLGEVCGRHDLHFGKFAEKIAGGRKLVRTYYYNIRQDSERDPNIATEQGKFLQTMYDTPYLEVRMGVSKRHGETMVEKGVDVYMATDLVAFAFMDLYDTAIVVSGDGDFFPAIQTAKNQGKHIEVAAFDNNLSSEAANVTDIVIKLNKTYFTGLWSDRRRRVDGPASSASSERRSRSTRAPRDNRDARDTGSSDRDRAGSDRTGSDRTTGTPANGDDSTSNGGNGGNGGTRRVTRRRSTTTRRRTPIRRTAVEAPEAPVMNAESTPDSAPEPTRRRSPARSSDRPEDRDRDRAPEPDVAAATNGGGASEAESESRTPIRRTPARRRVGSRSSSNGNGNGNGDGSTPTPPRPPAMRRRATSDNGDDGPAN
ncbi:MAG: NYN domain-containing protein [Chloroflexi bacterium]|nr:NYN domain-containing protein [Chloroflexota bacterium]